MSSVQYFLRDRSPDVVAAWQRYFADIPHVHPDRGDIFDVSADAVISPANSFGFMDGGIDLVYSRRFGWQVQERLQKLLAEKHEGELPVGMAVLIETDDPDLPYCISAPTMRAPCDVSDTLNAYLAFRASLRLIRDVNQEKPGTIGRVLCPGLATATGRMDPEICAKQMHAAYLQVEGGQPWHATDINEIINEHYRLLRKD